jgi:hypothetical protein
MRLIHLFPQEQRVSIENTANPVTRLDVIQSFLLTEFITLTRAGAPVCWPVLCEFEAGRIVVSTPYIFPTKAHNARRNPKVAAFFSDPTAQLHRRDAPFVLVQGQAEVFDQNLQANTERFFDGMFRFPKTPGFYKLLMRIPGLMQSYVGYMTRIYIEITPQRSYDWERRAPPPAVFRACRPEAFTPGVSIQLPAAVDSWLPRYTEPPVLAFVDQAGYPAAVRVQATLERERVVIKGGIPASAGAPASLNYHRVAPDMMSNDSFMIRGHFDADGNLAPEKVVGWQGSEDDRGAGSQKAIRLMGEWRKRLAAQLAHEGRSLPVVRMPRK